MWSAMVSIVSDVGVRFSTLYEPILSAVQVPSPLKVDGAAVVSFDPVRDKAVDGSTMYWPYTHCTTPVTSSTVSPTLYESELLVPSRGDPILIASGLESTSQLILVNMRRTI